MIRKNILMPVLLAAVILMTACGGKKESGTASESGETPIRVDVEESEETTEEEEEAEPEAISEEDANTLLTEKLDGLGVSAIYDSEAEVGEEAYYTYTVIDSQDNEMDQMLAVDEISGEIYVYDFEKEEISDFKTFSLYDPERDADVSWEGKYQLDDMTVNLDPGDGNSFEFTFKDETGENVFAGVASVDGKSASYEDDQISLTFSFETDGSLKIANNGNINEYAGIYTPASE